MGRLKGDLLGGGHARPALESSASVSATDGQIDSWRAVLLYQLLQQDTSQQTKQTNKQQNCPPAAS